MTTEMMTQKYEEIVKKYQDSIITPYYANGARKIKKMTNRVLRELNFFDIDKDDYYSLVDGIFLDLLGDYDGKSNFESFLYVCLKRKFKTFMRDSNRDKRKNKIKVKNDDGEEEKVIVSDISLDTPLEEDNDFKISDILPSEINVEKEVFGEIYSDRLMEFMSMLTPLQKEIVELIMENFSSDEIKEKLEITDSQYKNAWNEICSYEKRRILYSENTYLEDEKMNTENLIEDVAESYKNTSFSIESISKQLSKKRIRDDHILQRHSGQWKGFAKSELISDILRGKSLTQIIISEEIKSGVRMQWLIDGKQRCTTLDSYLHDEFSISKNVKNYNIRYQTAKFDENGNEVLNDEGFPIMEFKTFDIRGKKFKQLPDELQEIFKDRQIPVLYNTNCTKKDIADDIARFNRSRPMNKSQNGWLGLDEYFAEFVGNISKMQFFQPEFAGTSYTAGNHTSGEIRRIIVEAIMLSDFTEDYNRDFDKMCEFLSEEASDSNFTEFYSFIERLTAVSNEESAKMFDKKDSFIWLALFSKFTNLGLSDEKFIDFMIEFSTNETLHTKKINGKTYQEFCIDPETKKAKSTKDKNIVIPKLELLEAIMVEYLGVNSKDNEHKDLVRFVKKNVNSSVMAGDIEYFKSILEDWKIGIDENSEINSEKNLPSMIAIAGYISRMDEDAPDDETVISWFEDFVKRNEKYIRNQQENFEFMKNDLENYLKEAS